jgi:hypothetical protein
MRDDRRACEPELVGARALREWITGESEEYPRVFLVDNGASAECIEEVAGHDDVVLLPEAGGAYAGRARVVRYRGALCEIGDELFIGERGVELQDYVAAAFVQIIGPTAVSLTDASGWDAFLLDAELARATGVFPSALIDPRVILADRSALAKPSEIDPPSAVRVRHDGTVSIGMRGETIGRVEELEASVAIPRPALSALEGTASREELAADLARRDWVGRYLNATDLMKMLRLANGDARISGFGWTLVDDDLADAEPLTTDPFLLETREGFLLADTRTLRRQLLSPMTAGVVAVIQTSSTPEVAAERVALQLGIPASEADRLWFAAAAALNIHIGTRTDASCPAAGIER